MDKLPVVKMIVAKTPDGWGNDPRAKADTEVTVEEQLAAQDTLSDMIAAKLKGKE